LIRSQLVASTSPFKPLDGGHPAVATTPTPIPTQLDDPGIVTGMWNVTGQYSDDDELMGPRAEETDTRIGEGSGEPKGR
jgi:hypothetical protein